MNAMALSFRTPPLPMWGILISAVLGLLLLYGVNQIVLLQYVISSAAYALLLHPLKRFPGPLLWRASRIRLMVSVHSGTMHRDLHHLHSVWGPVVRVAPNELSFVDAQAFQDIYGRRKGGLYPFPKDPSFYERAPNGAYNLVGCPDEMHAHMRHLINRAFSEKAVQEQEIIVKDHTRKFLDVITSLTSEPRSIADIGCYISWLTFDILVDLCFGESFHCLDSSTYRDLVDLLFAIPKAIILSTNLNSVRILKPFLLLVLPSDLLARAKRLWEIAVAKVKQRLESDTIGRPDIMSYLIPNPTRSGLSVPELEANGLLLMFAGAETTGSLLSAAVSYLLRSPSVLDNLQGELDRSYKTTADISFTNCTNLPYLNAVIREALRLAPPVPGYLPRVVPLGGGTVCGDVLPAGTQVSVSLFAAHHDLRNFALANRFIPERWFDTTKQQDRTNPLDAAESGATTFASDCRAAFQPFSVGPRNCAGVNLAWAEMRFILAALVLNFKLDAPLDRDPLVWETQKAYATWERQPLPIWISRRYRKAD